MNTRSPISSTEISSMRRYSSRVISMYWPMPAQGWRKRSPLSAIQEMWRRYSSSLTVSSGFRGVGLTTPMPPNSYFMACPCRYVLVLLQMLRRRRRAGNQLAAASTFLNNNDLNLACSINLSPSGHIQTISGSIGHVRCATLSGSQDAERPPLQLAPCSVRAVLVLGRSAMRVR